MAKNKIDEAYVELLFDDKELKRQLGKTEKKVKKSAKKLGDIFKSEFSKIAAGIGILMALRKAVDFTKEIKNLARDAEEIRSKFNTVFSSIAGQANKTANEFSKSFRLATSTAQELLGSTGDLLVGFGFAEQEALNLSNQVNRLAVDLASFSNYEGGAKGASVALTKALLGETESAKSLGIVIRQNTKDFTRQVMEIVRTTGKTEQQAKAIVILDQAYKQSAKAVGDFARTQDSLANQERILDEKFKGIKEELGNQVTPVFRTFIFILTQFIDNLGDASGSLNAFGMVAKGIATPLIIIMTLLKQVGNVLGTVGAAIVKFWTFDFSGTVKVFSLGLDIMQKDAATMGTALTEMWKSTAEKINNIDLTPGGGAGGGGGPAKIVGLMTKLKNQLEELQKIDPVNEEGWRSLNAKIKEAEDGLKRLSELMPTPYRLEGGDITAKGTATMAEQIPGTMSRKLTPEGGGMGTEAARYDEAQQRLTDLTDQLRDQLVGAVSEVGNTLVSVLDIGDTTAGKIINKFTQTVSAVNSIYNTFLAIAETIKALQTASSAVSIIGTVLGIGAHSGGNFVGTSSGVKKMASGGSFIVPGGYANDSYPMMVESGERVTVTPKGQTSFNDKNMVARLDGLASRVEALTMATIKNKQAPTYLIMDSKVVAEAITKQQNNFANNNIKMTNG